MNSFVTRHSPLALATTAAVPPLLSVRGLSKFFPIRSKAS